MDIFDHALQKRMKTEAPLAARMRPRTLDGFVDQKEIVGPGKLLRRAIEADRLFSSIILWGPPGTGKTTLAVRQILFQGLYAWNMRNFSCYLFSGIAIC